LEERLQRHASQRAEKAQGAGEGERTIEAIGRRSGSRQRHAQGHQLKKLVKPADRRVAADYLQADHGIGATRACGLVQIS